jgi:predicted RNA-binding Zn-ribbon protein involved in translation (DUF1610 family)
MNQLLFLITLSAVINGIYYGWQYYQEANWVLILHNTQGWISNFWNNDVNTLHIMYVLIAVMIPYGIISTRRSNRWYKSLPTSSEYSNKYLKDKKGSGFQCRQCGSKSIRNWGRAGAQDSERIFICNHCGSHLYRN